MKLDVAAALVDGSLVPGRVEIVDGLLTAYGLSGAGRGIAVPGFVDLQVNGFGGVDFLEADADGYRRAGEALLETGVTAFMPTLITAPEETLVAALAEIPANGDDTGARVLGVHLEGPFLSAWRLGTHPPVGRRDPDRHLLERLLAAGPVRIMTLAPELPGALDLIDILVARGVVVSCGHTDASVEQAELAFDRGARAVTHLFHAMRPFMHRDPGIVGSALTRDDVFVQIIVDGVHLAPETTSLVWSAAAGRTALVTDAVAPASGGDESYSLGSVELSLDDGAVRGPDGILAGSVLTMIDAVRNLHALDVPLELALAAASTVPARILGRHDIGSLDIGRPADLVVLDDNLEVETVLLAGEARVVA
ncbi:MAG: N-acetylglucosamine-6-phosphate deacetylase [Gaiellaceae bacterium]